MLLEAGADPNPIENLDGIFWGEMTPMGRFNRLRKLSPLYICRRLECFLEDRSRGKEDVRNKIEAMLLEFGAEEFVRT
jgi:hypothetical protein